ncbi:sphingolipid delta(4)-desaturase DES1 [Neodiprion pinetum]|uniref:sphingolipid 4-desaturase n=1 Tax=Neodiprion lecontei TaxID=441921 RepID=A0A6J0BM21_NEOLC|nr:sphingolipid delta(4)-desaturase DES1 [Neodiprion lecontei]XP_046421383.1 sphingolipid delta(4)-desaturase DES1 [Neodiprion fabricii]XP_046477876.1 sphingolipid delta(4)-desaturase DES1 [Neodiprion pinetum]XP_046617016.1 sphingolipid delta(4)-desaturase DES1 [Neodiprion virginianus]
MGQRVSQTDFEWVYTEEPHASRRKIILEKYPQIKKLFGYDPNFKWVVTAMVLVQFASMFIIKDLSYPMIFLVAYCFGGVINHSLMLAIHEISHNLAFGHARPLANKIFGFFANLPIGIPVSISFKKYHLEHHRYQGDEKLDTDLPTLIEAKLFCTTFGKLCWVLLQPFFYAFRPLVTYPKAPTTLEYINLVIQLIFDAIVWYFLGGKVLVYFIFGSVMAMGLHPVAGHFISEHYMYKKGFETYSYYGPLNFITFNVGYHNEHHDFPSVPGSRLPEVKRIAPEFYDDLPQHNSWVSVLYDFVMDPEIGPYARIKRKHRGLAS